MHQNDTRVADRERLVSLGIMGAHLRAPPETHRTITALSYRGHPLKPLGPSQHYRIEGFKRSLLNSVPHYAETRLSLGQRVPFFSCLDISVGFIFLMFEIKIN